jgi:1,4-alpha-glucan branching enzyme
MSLHPGADSGPPPATALRGENIQVFHIHNGNRIIAFHRWIENVSQDVVVVASLNESTFYEYQLGFPGSGSWLEIFNSDIYDHWVNPNGAGNGGQIAAQGPPTHGLPCSAKIVIPATAILVFIVQCGERVKPPCRSRQFFWFSPFRQGKR